MLLRGKWLLVPCAVMRAVCPMARVHAVRWPPVLRSASMVAAITVLLCAARTASGGVPPASVALRPLDTRWPVPLLISYFVELEAPYSAKLLFAAYDDGRIIFRAPNGGGYRTVIDTTLVRQLYGSASERAAYAALRDVRMPPEWQWLDGGWETMCLWTGEKMRCHHLDNPLGEYIGRPEMCTRFAHDSRLLGAAACRAHATLPAPFAAYYRRVYDAVQERSATAAPWVPDRVLLMVEKAKCFDGVRTRTPWPEGVPRPRDGERVAKTEGREVRRIAMTAEQARRLREVDHVGCFAADGSAWALSSGAEFELPNVGGVWSFGG